MPYEELQLASKKTSFSLEYYESDGKGGKRRRPKRFPSLELTLDFLLQQDPILNANDFRSITFSDFVAFWHHHEKEVVGVTKRTIDDRQAWLKRYAFPLFGSTFIGDISKSELRAYYNGAAEHYAPSSLAVVVSVITGVMNFAHSKRCILINPIAEFKATLPNHKLPPPKVVNPRADDAAEIRRRSPPTMLAYLDLLELHAVKTAEVERLREDDLLPFHALKNGDQVRRLFLRDVVLKGDDPDKPAGRLVPISEKAICSLLVHKSRARRIHGLSTDLTFGADIKLQRGFEHLHLYCNILRKDHSHKDKPAGRNTPRDYNHRAVLSWISQGMRTKQIARLAGLSEKVVYERYKPWLIEYQESDQMVTARVSEAILAAIEMLPPTIVGHVS